MPTRPELCGDYTYAEKHPSLGHLFWRRTVKFTRTSDPAPRFLENAQWITDPVASNEAAKTA